MKHNQDKAVSRLDDEDLWRAFQRGSHPAYEAIYQQHVRVMFNYGWKLCEDRDLVKDCIQELFYYLWEHRAGLGPTDNIRRYLLVALRRRLVRQLKQSTLREDVSEHQIRVPSSEAEWIVRQTHTTQQENLQLALRHLPERQKEAVYLKYYQNLGSDEIAEIMDINRRAVYKLLTKAIKNLKKYWVAPSNSKSAITWIMGFFLLIF